MATNLAPSPVMLAKIVEGSEGSARVVAVAIGCVAVLAGLLLVTNFKNFTVWYESLQEPFRQLRSTKKRWMPSVAGWRVIGAVWIVAGVTMALGGLLHSPNSG